MKIQKINKKLLNRLKKLFVFAPLAILVFVLFFKLVQTRPQNNCSFILSAQSAICFEREIGEILKTNDMDAAIKFVKEEIINKNAGYDIVHLIFHYLGEFAYTNSGDLEETLSYLEPYIYRGNQKLSVNEFMDGMDGYLHGSVSRYFIDNSDKSLDYLIGSVCDRDFKMGNTKWKLPECYHTVGHALMAAKGNDIFKSILVCDGLINKADIDTCSYGVFMENAFLYRPNYHNGLPRPNVSGDSMAKLCSSFLNDKRIICSRLIGASLRNSQDNVIKQGFIECEKAKIDGDSDLAYRGCVEMFAFWIITTKNKGEFINMISNCNLPESQYRGSCLKYVALGIKLGESGKKYKSFDFCALVERKLRKECIGQI